MRPVIEKKKFELRHILYIIMITICVVAIGIGVYMQFFKDEKLGVIFGITRENEDIELKQLKESFINIFSNDIEVITEYSGSIQKVKEDNDYVLSAYDKQEQNDKYSVDIKIPYFNIKEEETMKLNQKIKSIFEEKFKSVMTSTSNDNIIYNVKYKAYLNNNILSLVILSELKEGNSNQRVIIKTYNYNLSEKRVATINDIINNKNLDVKQANDSIKSTVDNSQEENLKLRELGYPIDVRNSDSDEYKLENAKNFFIGEKGYLFIIYPYGNNEATSEMDIVIIR